MQYKTMWPSLWVLVVGLECLILATSQAQPMPLPDTEKLLQAGTLICAGTVKSHDLDYLGSHGNIAIEGLKPGRVVEAILDIEALYKGDAARVGDLVSVLFTGPEGAFLQKGEHVVVFLTAMEQPKGHFRFADEYYGKLSVAPDRPRLEKAAAPIEAIIAELRHNLESGEQGLVRHAVDALIIFDLKDEGALKIAEGLSDSPETAVAACALRYRLFGGDVNAFDRAVELLDGCAGECPTSDLRRLLLTLDRVEHQIPVSRFNELLENTRVPVLRQKAADILREIGDASSVPLLVRTLTSDRAEISPSVKYQCMAGLYRIVRSGRGSFTSRPVFDEDPSTYIEWWRKWWEETGKAKYAPEK